MLMSELCMDGIVVDLGHEMTQIVPIYGGMTDIRKVSTFKVGGITMDSMLMTLFQEKMVAERSDSALPRHLESKYMHYRTRTKFKEELHKLKTWDLETGGNDATDRTSGFPGSANKNYELPDGTNLEMEWLEGNWHRAEMHPIDCYLSSEAYKAAWSPYIKPLWDGKSRTMK